MFKEKIDIFNEVVIDPIERASALGPWDNLTKIVSKIKNIRNWAYK
ncbi:MAG: hypothetical protein R2825_27100 [Saprospiraceae bacterium]